MSSPRRAGAARAPAACGSSPAAPLQRRERFGGGGTPGVHLERAAVPFAGAPGIPEPPPRRADQERVPRAGAITQAPLVLELAQGVARPVLLHVDQPEPLVHQAQ